MFATFKGVGGDVIKFLLAFLAKPYGQIITTCLLVYVYGGIKADDFFCQVAS